MERFPDWKGVAGEEAGEGLAWGSPDEEGETGHRGAVLSPALQFPPPGGVLRLTGLQAAATTMGLQSRRRRRRRHMHTLGQLYWWTRKRQIKLVWCDSVVHFEVARWNNGFCVEVFTPGSSPRVLSAGGQGDMVNEGPLSNCVTQ